MKEFYSDFAKPAMRFQRKVTNDNSVTVWDSLSQETYKSSHAARTESETIFFTQGIRNNVYFPTIADFYLLECGFGIGTNFLNVSTYWQENIETSPNLHYTGIDRDFSGLDFFLEQEDNALTTKENSLLKELQQKNHYTLNEKLFARIQQIDFLDFLKRLPPTPKYHAIFFDPFSPKAEPNSWSEDIFQHLYPLLYPGGRLVTYSVARLTKDNLRNAGFTVEKFSLPPILHKRSALLATRE